MAVSTHHQIQSFHSVDPLSRSCAQEILRFLATELAADRLPRQALAEMHAFYDPLLTWEQHFLHHFASFLCEADAAFAVPATKPLLLDLGCGVGTQSCLMAIRGAKVVGVDNKPERVAAAQAMEPWYESIFHRPIHVDWHHCDVFQFLAEEKPQRFDGVYTQFSLAYMKPHAQVLQLVNRVLRPGGTVLFREFNAGNAYNRFISRVDWLTSRDYQTFGQLFHWQLHRRRFDWLFPRRVIGSRFLGPLAIALEDHLSSLPFFRTFAGSMTLVFRKRDTTEGRE